MGVLWRDDDLAGLAQCGVVVEFNNVSARAVPAAGEISRCDDSCLSIRRNIHAGQEARVNLSYAAIGIAIEQVDARVDFVVERVVHDVDPVRGFRPDRRYSQVLGGQGWRLWTGGS